MRFISFGVIILLLSCNAPDKKDPNQALDDTARMRDLPPRANMEIDARQLLVADIPPAIKVKGDMQDAWKWNDELGENIVVISRAGPFVKSNKTGEEEDETVELHVSHHTKNTGTYAELWKLTDQVSACPFDITAEFIPNSTTITDLDKDGIAEVKVQYSLACRSDVSPATMKLVMSENGQQYALRGTRWLAYSPEFKFTVTEQNVNLDKLPALKDETETMLRSFGRYENEKQFASANHAFIIYARKEWLKHVMGKIGD